MSRNVTVVYGERFICTQRSKYTSVKCFKNNFREVLKLESSSSGFITLSIASNVGKTIEIETYFEAENDLVASK
jgi:hypothetical protein